MLSALFAQQQVRRYWNNKDSVSKVDVAVQHFRFFCNLNDKVFYRFQLAYRTRFGHADCSYSFFSGIT